MMDFGSSVLGVIVKVRGPGLMISGLRMLVVTTISLEISSTHTHTNTFVASWSGAVIVLRVIRRLPAAAATPAAVARYW